jgi:hypothetical protein
MNTLRSIYPLMIQQYETFIPNIEGMDITQKTNSIIQYLNRIGKLNNDVVADWNKVMTWVMGEGLQDATNTKIDDLIAKGTFDDLLQTMFDEINTANTNFQNIINGQVNTLTSSLAEIASKGYTNVLRPYTPLVSAKGDGSTDDLIVIQNIINNVGQNGGGTIFFPKATYMLSSTLWVSYSNITLLGAGIDATILKATSTFSGNGLVKAWSTPSYITGNGNASYNMTSLNNIQIIDLTVNGNFTGTPSSTWGGIQFNQVNNGLISGCKLINFTDAGISLEGCTEVIVEKNIVDGGNKNLSRFGNILAVQNNFDPTSPTSSYRCIIKNNIIKNSTTVGFAFSIGAYDCIFEGNILKDNTNQHMLVEGSDPPQGKTQRNIITSNTFINGTDGIIASNSGSTFNTASLDDVVQNIISNNRFYNLAGNNIQVRCSNYLISENKIESPFGTGIQAVNNYTSIQLFNISITNNHITAKNGISVQGSSKGYQHVTVSNNIIIGNNTSNSNGILVESVTYGCIIGGNQVSNFYSNGIRLNNYAGGTVLNTLIHGNSVDNITNGYGIFANNSLLSPIIKGNVVTNCYNQGIQLNGVIGASITGNTSRSNQMGIALMDDGGIKSNLCVLTGNACISNNNNAGSRFGIYLKNTTNALITNNQFSEPNTTGNLQQWGIYEDVTCSNNIMTSNMLRGNQSGTISANGTTSTSTGNY